MTNIIGAGSLENRNFTDQKTDSKSFFQKVDLYSGKTASAEKVNLIESFIENSTTGLSESDTGLIKNMIKHDIELTSENISYIKKIISLKTEAAGRESEKGFLAELKSMSEDDILALFRNNIRLDSSSIKSFNNVIKGSNVLFNDLKEIVSSLNLKEQDYLTEVSEMKASAEMMNSRDNTFVPDSIKKQLISKLDDMKNFIKAIDTDDKNLQTSILNNFKDNFTDIRTFNSLSNQYYLMDVPFKMNSDQYDFKLFIKDDRKSGKLIDKTDVKIVISIRTVNIGSVDAYIKINGKNLMLDIRSLKDFAHLLNKNKAEIQGILNSLGYNSSVNVYKKEEEATIATAADFFNDNSFTGINIKV